MPYLFVNITGNVLQNIVGNVYAFSTITGVAQFEDYINLTGYVAYLQIFRQVETIEPLEKPQNFGLKNQYNLPTITLEISY